MLELARQIQAVGGDPQDVHRDNAWSQLTSQALATGTFPPGDVNDATGKGNTCGHLCACSL